MLSRFALSREKNPFKKAFAILQVLVLVLAGGLLNFLSATPAHAAIGDRPLITWNMQGASGSYAGSKWTYAVGSMVNNWITHPIVALQEAGSNPPPSANGTAERILSGNQLAALPVINGSQCPTSCHKLIERDRCASASGKTEVTVTPTMSTSSRPTATTAGGVAAVSTSPSSRRGPPNRSSLSPIHSGQVLLPGRH
jgi:hypothetical protein